jgi:fibronectin-binding autotransporter adhesin
LVVVVLAGGTASAGVLVVAGSPTYDFATGTGFSGGAVSAPPGSSASDSGTAVGYATKSVSGSEMGYRAVRWDASGMGGTELGDLGTSSSGATNAYAFALNNAGTAVGYAIKYVSGSTKGDRAVRWEASGTAATELGNLGTDSSGTTSARANALNAAGMAVGYATKYVGGTSKGDRAVRWEASGTAASELGNLGTTSVGFTSAHANDLNDAGTAVGSCIKYVSGTSKGFRAARWNASGTAATELGNLGTDSSGVTTATAYAVSAVGTAVGYANKYVGGSNKGGRAVRWDASGTAATELGNLGTDSSGITYAFATAVNAAGTAVGYAQKYVGGSASSRAVRWDASGTAATELGNLGTNSSGSTTSFAYAVNDAGTAVGYATKYVGGSNMGNHAVMWLPDASAVDLNDLGVAPVPSGGRWTLNTAKALSSDGWVAGEGTFDPDGTGPLAFYTRLWVAQVGLGGSWTRAAGGTWGRGPNWSTGTPAMQVGNAAFNLNSAYTVALDRDERTKTIALSAGTVTIDFASHTLTTESGLSISPGATLLGAGTLVGDVASAGTIDPGTSPGTLNIVGSLTNSGTLEFEIAGASLYDRIGLSGVFDARGTIKLKLLSGYVPSDGSTFDLMDFGGFTDHGYALDLSEAALPASLRWDSSAFASTGVVRVVAVPEPATVALLAVGVLALLAHLWRRDR